MPRRRILAFLSLVSLNIFQPLPVQAQGITVERFGLYVLVEDVERSRLFYEKLLGKPPQIRNAALVGFDVAGGLYALVPKRTYAPTATRGTSVRPYLKVRDIFGAFEHVKRLTPTTLESERVVEEGPFKFFRFADPDGNIIELFSVTASGAK